MNMSEELRQVCRVCCTISDELKKCTRCKNAYFCSSAKCREAFPIHARTEVCQKSIHPSSQELQRHQTNLSRYLSKLFQARIENSVAQYELRDSTHPEVVFCVINSGESDLCQNHRIVRILGDMAENGVEKKHYKSLGDKLNGSAMRFRSFIGSWDEVKTSISDDTHLGDFNDVCKMTIFANIELIKTRVEKGTSFVIVYFAGGVMHFANVFDYEEFISEKKAGDAKVLLFER